MKISLLGTVFAILGHPQPDHFIPDPVDVTPSDPAHFHHGGHAQLPNDVSANIDIASYFPHFSTAGDIGHAALDRAEFFNSGPSMMEAFSVSHGYVHMDGDDGGPSSGGGDSSPPAGGIGPTGPNGGPTSDDRVETPAQPREETHIEWVRRRSLEL